MENQNEAESPNVKTPSYRALDLATKIFQATKATGEGDRLDPISAARRIDTLLGSERAAFARKAAEVKIGAYDMDHLHGSGEHAELPKWAKDAILALAQSDLKALNERDKEQQHKGWTDCLRNVLASLEGYPNAGGDIGIMKEVDQIVQERMDEAVLAEHTLICPTCEQRRECSRFIALRAKREKAASGDGQ